MKKTLKRIKEKRITAIPLPTGEIANSLDETIQAIIQKYFPSDLVEKDNDLHEEYFRTVSTIYSSLVDSPFLR